MMKIKFVMIALLVICIQSVLSQTKTITGVVLDEEGLPLPGVTVLVQGTLNGTATDFDGNYTLKNVNATDILVFTYIGMAEQAIAVGNQTKIDVTLLTSAESLDEIIVVAYGTQSRAEVTGAISSVSPDELTAIPVANPEQALQGRAAGVNVTNSGSPGSNPTVSIRGLGTPGNNTPLYVIDGVITGNLSGISANDIASINVLKDASTTAIYGSQGSNGVIIVTTKKGKSGRAVLSLNTYTGFQNNFARYDVLNTAQYLQYASEAFGIVPNRPDEVLRNNTNWQDEIFRTGIIQNYDFNASGGTANSNYRFSAGYYDEEGIIIGTGFKRYSFRANSGFSFGKLRIGETMGLSFNSQNPELSGGGRSLIEHAIKAPPYLPVFNSENLGGYQGPSSPDDGQDAENPVRIQNLGNAINNTTAITGSLYAELEVVKGLVFRSQLGLDYFTFNNNRFVPSYDDDDLGATHTQAEARITKNSGTGRTITTTNSLKYRQIWADVHDFELLILAETYDNTFNFINASSRDPISDEIDQLSDEQSALSSGSFETQRIGYLGRLNYNYDQKYLIAASMRRDASSRFGANNRWGWFPSLALGWNMARENFLSNSNLSTLKLRGSWGLVGNDNIPNYAFSPTLTTNFTYPIGGIAAIGTTANGLPNPNLKWEETTQINIGLDVGLFNEKITLSLEYYNNTSDDLLIGRSTPTSLGFNTGFIIENVGSVETKGFELSLGYNDAEGDFTWAANLNLSTTTNEVKSLGLLDQFTGGSFENNDISRTIVGAPLFHFYGLETDGIYQNQAEVDAVFTADPDQVTVQPGDIRFVDQNGDGIINSEDRTIIGNPYADVNYGLNIDAAYKNFDLNIFITGVAGIDVFNTNIYDLEGMPRLFNAGVGVLDRWTPDHPSNSIPRAGGAPQNLALSDRYVEDGSYARLRNITLGYTLPNDLLGQELFSKFRIYMSGQNLITLTEYSGLDPEIASNSNNEFGIDRGKYPRPKTFLLGLQVSF